MVEYWIYLLSREKCDEIKNSNKYIGLDKKKELNKDDIIYIIKKKKKGYYLCSYLKIKRKSNKKQVFEDKELNKICYKIKEKKFIDKEIRINKLLKINNKIENKKERDIYNKYINELNSCKKINKDDIYIENFIKEANKIFYNEQNILNNINNKINEKKNEREKENEKKEEKTKEEQKEKEEDMKEEQKEKEEDKKEEEKQENKRKGKIPVMMHVCKELNECDEIIEHYINCDKCEIIDNNEKMDLVRYIDKLDRKIEINRESEDRKFRKLIDGYYGDYPVRDRRKGKIKFIKIKNNCEEYKEYENDILISWNV